MAFGYAGKSLAAGSDADLTHTVGTCTSTLLAVDQRIAACTALLAISGVDTETAALAHFYRGLAQLGIGRSEKDPAAGLMERARSALPDLDAAIALDPGLIAAYRLRASLHHYAKQFDASVSDYNKVIDAYPKVSGLYALRGTNLADGGHADAALTDYDTAFSLAAPDDALSRFHMDRIYVDETAGLWDQAIADLDKAMPAVKTPHQSFEVAQVRGRIDFMSGKFDAAITDLLKAQDLASEKDQYYLLWLYLAEARKGQDAAYNLRERLPFVDSETWPGPLLHYFAGDLPLDQVKPRDDATDREQRSSKCELEFFLGEVALMKGDHEAAAQHFHQAVDTGITGYVEYNSAHAELQRMAE